MNTGHRSHASDEALSALLDGFDEEGARAHVAGCEECSARLEGLDRARALVTTEVEPVDEMTRRRLVSQALTAGAPARAQRRLAVLSVAALAAVALVAVPLLSDGGGDGDLSAAGGGTFVAPEVFVGNLGKLDEPTAVRDAMGATTLTGGGGVVGSGAGSSGGTTVGEDDGAAESQTDAPDAAPQRSSADAQFAPIPSGPLPKAVERCARSVESADPSPSGQLVFAATGTFGGHKAVVLAYREGQRAFALIVARPDCSILTTQSFDVP